MDPVSAAFVSYIDFVSQRAMEQANDELSTAQQSAVVEHHGIRVPYSYQAWKIEPQSVCDDYRSDMTRFSDCTVAAQSLFNEICTYLQDHPQAHWSHRRLTDMYCAAAITFEPTLASIRWSREPSALDRAREECSLAVAELMKDQSPESRGRKEQACSRYHELQARSARH